MWVAIIDHVKLHHLILWLGDILHLQLRRILQKTAFGISLQLLVFWGDSVFNIDLIIIIGNTYFIIIKSIYSLQQSQVKLDSASWVVNLASP